MSANQNNAEPYLPIITIKDACDLTGREKATIKKWMREGSVTTQKGMVYTASLLRANREKRQDKKTKQWITLTQAARQCQRGHSTMVNLLSRGALGVPVITVGDSIYLRGDLLDVDAVQAMYGGGYREVEQDYCNDWGDCTVVSDLLGIPKSTVVAWARSGAVVSRKSGRTRQVSLNDVQEHMRYTRYKYNPRGPKAAPEPTPEPTPEPAPEAAPEAVECSITDKIAALEAQLQTLQLARWMQGEGRAAVSSSICKLLPNEQHAGLISEEVERMIARICARLEEEAGNE